MSAFNRELAKTQARMEKAAAFAVREAMKVPGNITNEGIYYEGGPVCIEVRTAKGTFIASCKKSDF